MGEKGGREMGGERKGMWEGEVTGWGGGGREWKGEVGEEKQRCGEWRGNGKGRGRGKGEVTVGEKESGKKGGGGKMGEGEEGRGK